MPTENVQATTRELLDPIPICDRAFSPAAARRYPRRCSAAQRFTIRRICTRDIYTVVKTVTRDRGGSLPESAWAPCFGALCAGKPVPVYLLVTPDRDNSIRLYPQLIPASLRRRFVIESSRTV